MKQDIIYFIGFGFFNYHSSEEPKGFLPGLKIGYTSNWETRKLSYLNKLLDFEEISFRPGDKTLEHAIHLWYSDYKLMMKTKLMEWFRDYNYIRNTFDIIPDAVFLRYSENVCISRELNILYNFSLKYLLKFPEDSFQRGQLWRAILGSGLNVSKKSEIDENLIRELYDFSKKYLIVDFNKLDEILDSLDKLILGFNFLTDLEKKNLEAYSKADAILLKTVFEDRIKLCCEYFDEDPNHPVFNYLPKDYLRYLKEVGISGITSVSYSHSKLEKMIKNNAEVKNSRNLFLNEFRINYKPGDRISLRELKEFFRLIRDKYKLSFSPKANLIKEYCSVVDTMITDKVTKKRLQAFKIISINDK